MPFDPIVLTLPGTIFNGAIVLLLVVVFVPATAAVLFMARSRD